MVLQGSFCLSRPGSLLTCLAYRQEGVYRPHFFALEDPEMRQVHGRLLDPTIEMRVQPREYIDEKLANWHYRQCVLARIRGFSEGFDNQGNSGLPPE